MAAPSENYSHGHHESVLRSHSWRTVQNSAAYLAPHLTSGTTVLDVGCGPGTITIEPANLIEHSNLWNGRFTAQLRTPWDAKPGRHPEGWPDAFSGWYWPSAPDGNHSHPIGQRAYWYHELTLEEVAPVILIHTSDDIGTLGFDGALVDAGTNPPGVQWVNATAVGIEQITGLTHYVTGRSTNTATYYDNPTNTWNPGAFACVAYQQLSSIYLNYDNIIMRTSGGPSSGDPLLGGGWLCTSRDFGDPEPGFTPGRAFRLLFEQAQAAGFLVGWTLDFDDNWDSNDET